MMSLFVVHTCNPMRHGVPRFEARLGYMGDSLKKENLKVLDVRTESQYKMTTIKAVLAAGLRLSLCLISLF